MPGQRFKLSAFAALTVLTAGAAHAADYSQPYQPPPPQPVIIQQPQEALRPELVSARPCRRRHQRDYDLDYLINPANSNDFAFEQHSIDDTPFIGGGVGYEFNNWLRFDATAEYRAKTRVNAFGTTPSGGGTFGDTYRRLPEILGVPGQCLCRSRHLGLLHALRRRRHRRRLRQLADFTDINPSARRAAASAATRANGISPGRSMPASATRSPRISTSI